MDIIFDTLGAIILISFVSCVILGPFIFIWRGIMIPKTWGQVEVTIIEHRRYTDFDIVEGRSRKATTYIEYTIGGLDYQSFYYLGRGDHNLLQPVGTKEIRYYNPNKPNKTKSKEECASMIRSGIFMLASICVFGLLFHLLFLG